MADREQRPFAELIGTALFLGLLFAMMLSVQRIPSWAIGGIALAVPIIPIMRFSGSHFNPAVSLAQYLSGRMLPVGKLFPYWFAQLVGGMLAVVIVNFLKKGHLGTAVAKQLIVRPASGYDLVHVLAMEASGTLGLCLAVAIASRAPLWAKPFIVGGALAVILGVVGERSGGAINPVRALAPLALCPSLWGDMHLVVTTAVCYVCGPLLGAVIAAWIYMQYLADTSTTPPS